MKKQPRSRMVSWMILSSAMTLPCLGDVALDPGSGLFRPGTGSVPTYTNANPSWASNLILAMLNAPMVGAFSGSVTTKVIALNGVDASGGLGFTYQFNLSGDIPELHKASWSPNGWSGITISDAGSNGTGSSTAAPDGPNWTNGDPFEIDRDSGALPFPSVIWEHAVVGGGLAGTSLVGNNFSAVIFFKTNATAWQNGVVGLLDGGAVGTAAIFNPGVAIPSPSAVVLGIIGMAPLAFRRRRTSGEIEV